MTRMRLLDLFCGAGGCSVGYARVGFDVTGVDIVQRRGYPFEFHQADALEFLAQHGHEFDAIHASPPCQAYSTSTTALRNEGKEYPDLLGPTRDALIANGKPWVIENVPGSPMRADYKLCGCYFDLPNLRRERWFETSWNGFALMPPHHHTDIAIPVTGHGAPSSVRKALGYTPSTLQLQACMGIDWMNRDDMSLAIPPAYTEFMGGQLLAAIAAEVAS